MERSGTERAYDLLGGGRVGQAAHAHDAVAAARDLRQELPALQRFPYTQRLS